MTNRSHGVPHHMAFSHLGRTLCFALALGLTACAASTPSWRPAQATVVLAHGEDPRVGTYVSSGWGFNTNTFWIEGPDGLVLIDTQFLPSAAEEAARWAEAATGKRVVLAIVLHANPDKFNGTAALQARGVRVITSQQVADLIPQVHTLRHGWFYERYRPDYPNDTPHPDAFGATTTTIDAAGTRLKLHVLGPGCSEAHVVVEWEGHVFTGDLVANMTHSWLEIGKTDEWITRLEEIQAMRPRFVHPGRGASGGDELLVRERRYLERVMEIVADANPVLEPTPAMLDAVRERVEAAYPSYGFTAFLRVGLPAEYARQARARAAAGATSSQPTPEGPR